jgi:hypothetical protein
VQASSYWQDSLITGVLDTAERFIGGVIDTGYKNLGFWLFLTLVNDTADKFFPPAINCIDDRGLFFPQNYLQPPKSAMAADIVIGKGAKAPQKP